MVTLLHLTLLSILSCCVFFGEAQDCAVKINNGEIFGVVKDTFNPLQKVCSYTGIPFASPPLGPLRFKPPQPAEPWNTPLNATGIPNWCPQGPTPPPGVEMSEDCLYLNVFRPIAQNTSNDTLPVMIWIHGGAFMLGSAGHPHSPERLLAKGNVILVVVQYRLGLLGFLSTGDEVAPGNYGLKDQQFSIRWVHENINAFGGNPEKITIFGQSAGGASVIYQLITPLNKGLIHGVIAQSGTALGMYAIDKHPVESSQFMAGRLGCPTTSSEMIVDCLQNMEWEKIIAEQEKLIVEQFENLTYPVATMAPVVEPDLPGAFITEEPADILKDGDVDNTIPVILGATKHDGSNVLAMLYLYRMGPLGLDKDPDYMRNSIVPEILTFTNVQEDKGNRPAASSTELAYLFGVNRSSWEASMPGLVDILTTVIFKSSTMNTAELLSRRGSKVYLYSFEHHSLNTQWDPILDPLPVNPGIAHADDLMYLFNYENITLSRGDESFSELFCDLWLNFGRFGNPTPSPSEAYQEWPLYNAQEELYMKLNATPTVFSDYHSSWRPNGFQWN